jgi:hypothetical protein
MAKVKRGLKAHSRSRAKNYSHEQAQARLEETVRPFNDQVDNSLRVNSVEIEYYGRQALGNPCTCSKTRVVTEYASDNNTLATPQIATRDKTNRNVGIDFQSGLYGDYGEQEVFSEDIDVLDMIDELEEQDGMRDDYEEPEFEESLMQGGNVDCGICYRVGFDPAFQSYGQQRLVLSSINIAAIDGYHINPSSKPHTLERALDEGFIEYEVLVPKYFVNVTFSVRDNRDIIEGAKLYDTSMKPITSAHFTAAAGKELKVRVREKVFTHASIQFESKGVEPIFANLSGESNTLDYSRQETIGALTVVLPPRIPVVNTGDIIVIRSRRLVLKVTDKERKITSDKRRLEWVCTARVLQPSESLKQIHTGTKLIRGK